MVSEFAANFATPWWTCHPLERAHLRETKQRCIDVQCAHQQVGRLVQVAVGLRVAV